MTLILAALFFLQAPPARGESAGGAFLLEAPSYIVTERFLLEGAGLELVPSAGDPTSGLLLEGGDFALIPAPVFGGAPPLAARPDLSEAHAYPVPFRPSLGHSKIRFTGLTREAEVTVYTPMGERVRGLRNSGGGPSLDWSPVSNNNGERVASGLYLYVIKDPVSGELKRGKLIVVR